MPRMPPRRSRRAGGRCAPTTTSVLLPQADGGEGTLAAIAAAVAGAVLRSAGDVTGPDGRPTPGHWLQLPDGTAVVELAQASGLPLMAAPDPLGATTRGLGEVIARGPRRRRDRPRDRARRVGVDRRRRRSARRPRAAAARRRRPPARRRRRRARAPRVASTGRVCATRPRAGCACSATSPRRCSARPARRPCSDPQKGADADDVRTLDAALATLRGGCSADGAATPGAGAAGGTGYGFLAAWGARIESGSRAIATLTGLATEAASADVVITGEGRFDATSTTGKVVGTALALVVPGRRAPSSSRAGSTRIRSPPTDAPSSPSRSATWPAPGCGDRRPRAVAPRGGRCRRRPPARSRNSVPDRLAASCSRASRGTRRARGRRHPGTCPTAAARRCARAPWRWSRRGCASARARSAGGRGSSSTSGQRDCSRRVVSRPRNHLESANGTPRVIENSSAWLVPIWVDSKKVPCGVSVYW